ncbi:spore coat protein U domain-containing protein [Polaromonas sp. JS666]|uniref:spore coat protein U domain-containing protein n=1 Tax=Polaromonas sp. (strain JS666 / ATCC BAA-500) TaxID=296591 RepID=UPI000889D84D|nr:spore coat protein U domain-containing protein [Polaromonas sp. JS666]SDN88703.1 Spore Coat Protein U domain-containing protein [Polaromonas sp. JS666]
MSVSYASRIVLAALLCTCALRAQAAITCQVTSTGFTAVYSETIATANDTTGSYTVTCTRGLTSDPITFAYTLRANDGLNANAPPTNRAAAPGGGVNRINYELYRTAAGTGPWNNTTATAFAGTVIFGTTTTMSASDSKPFYARIPALQNVKASTFTDTVTMSLLNSVGTTVDTDTLAVTIINTTSCQFTTPPGTMTFNYTSFQTTAATANTPYSVRCTSGVSYTPSLSATGGTLLNLPYTLTLSNPATVSANGLPQNYTINGSIAAGLSGTCAGPAAVICTGQQPRTLTITY